MQRNSPGGTATHGGAVVLRLVRATHCLCLSVRVIFRVYIVLYAFSIKKIKYACGTAQLKCELCGNCPVKQNGYNGTLQQSVTLTS